MTDYRDTQAVTIPEGTPRSAAFAFASELDRCLHDFRIDIDKAVSALDRFDDNDYTDGFVEGVALARALSEAQSDLDRWQKRQAALVSAAVQLPRPAPKPPTADAQQEGGAK